MRKERREGVGKERREWERRGGSGGKERREGVGGKERRGGRKELTSKCRSIPSTLYYQLTVLTSIGTRSQSN